MSLEQIKELIAKGNLHVFYASKEWLGLRRKVLKQQNYECQQCKKKGKYRKATTVHHIKELIKYPELALHENNMKCLCRECHEREHGRLKKETFTNEERW